MGRHVHVVRRRGKARRDGIVAMVCVGGTASLLWYASEGRLFDVVRRRGTALGWMVCVGEGRLVDGMRRRDGFVMVCAGEGRHIDGEHRRDGCWRASVWDGVSWRCFGWRRLCVVRVGVGRRFVNGVHRLGTAFVSMRCVGGTESCR